MRTWSYFRKRNDWRRRVRRWLLGSVRTATDTLKHQWFAILFIGGCAALALVTMNVKMPGGW